MKGQCYISCLTTSHCSLLAAASVYVDRRCSGVLLKTNNTGYVGNECERTVLNEIRARAVRTLLFAKPFLIYLNKFSRRHILPVTNRLAFTNFRDPSRRVGSPRTRRRVHRFTKTRDA